MSVAIDAPVPPADSDSNSDGDPTRLGDSPRGRRSQGEPRQGAWVLITANPFSGRKRNDRIVKRFREALGGQGLASRVVWDPSERTELLADAHATRDCVCAVAAGGDGTLADLLTDGPAMPVAVLPLGNENLFAKHFGFVGRAHSERLARAIRDGRTRRVDVGQAGDRMFSSVVSAGFDAEVVRRLARWRSAGPTLRRVHTLNYVRPALETIFRYDYPRVRLETDHGEAAEGSLVLVFNIPRYAAGLPLAPDARGDDGKLDWVLFEKPGLLPLSVYALAVLLKRHRRRDDVRYGRCASLTLTGLDREDVPLQLDGDAFAATPVRLRVRERAFHVIEAS